MTDNDPILLDVDVDLPNDNVLLKLEQGGHPIVIPMKPQTGFELGEKLARAAHAVKFPHERIEDGSYIASQVRARATDQMRDRAVQRLTIMVQNDFNDKKSPGKMAVAYVDTILNLFGVK